MVTVFCTSADWERRIARVLAGRTAASFTNDWDRFERIVDERAGAVVALDSLDLPIFDRLCTFKAAAPAIPIVLITRGSLDNARLLRSLIVEEVLWGSEVDAELWPSVGRLRVRGVLARLADRFGSIVGIAPTLRRSLALACTRHPPLHSVVELATATGCSTSTLWHHWRRLVGHDERLRLEDLVDWVILIHAAAHKTPHRSWLDVAADLHVHEHTLERVAHRLAGVPLREATPGALERTLVARVDALLAARGRRPGTSRARST